MRPGMLSIFPDDVSGKDIINWMNNSNYDELIEIDINADILKNLYHVPGKYFVPSLYGANSSIWEYADAHMIHPDDREAHRAFLDASTMLDRMAQADPPGCLYGEYRYKLYNGSWRWTGNYVFCGSEYGLREGVVHIYVFDIQNRIDRSTGMADEFYRPSIVRDTKTRLISRNSFFTEATRLIEQHPDEDWCVMAIDLEHFRLFNDWYGRDKGDLLLARVGEQLFEFTEAHGGVAGYFGQDDFFVLTPYNQNRITALYRDVTGLFGELVSALGFRAMFGIAMADIDAPMLDLIDHAKLALELTRRNVKMGVCLYESKFQERENREYEVMLDFKDGIVNHEFQAYLQPQCHISTGKVVGAEALARWRKPDGTVVSPADFIPALEKNGFIADLDRYMCNQVCANLRRWIDAGHEPVPVSVNVSQSDFYSLDVPEMIDSIVQKYQLPKHLLKVEITESTFAENAQVVANATQRLRDMGYVVLMDDFGSGYSSLNMLNSLNVDVIKLDAGFFTRDDDESKSASIVESVVGMVTNLGLPIIAEGVEDRDQVEFLERLGCHFIQGFYYYRPMTPEQFEDLIRSGEMIDHDGVQ